MRLLLNVGYADIRRDSAIQASLMALAAPNVQYCYYSTHILTFFSFLLFYLFSDMFLILRQFTLTDVRQSVVLIVLREVEAHLFTIL